MKEAGYTKEEARCGAPGTVGLTYRRPATGEPTNRSIQVTAGGPNRLPAFVGLTCPDRGRSMFSKHSLLQFDG